MFQNSEVRQPLGIVNRTPNRREKSIEDSLCKTVPNKRPPQPQDQPLRGQFKPPEISR